MAEHLEIEERLLLLQADIAWPATPHLAALVGARIRGPVVVRRPWFQNRWALVAAAVLAIESLVFVGVHARYRETGTIIVCLALGLFMAFIAYGRMVLKPLL